MCQLYFLMAVLLLYTNSTNGVWTWGGVEKPLINYYFERIRPVIETSLLNDKNIFKPVAPEEAPKLKLRAYVTDDGWSEIPWHIFYLAEFGELKIQTENEGVTKLDVCVWVKLIVSEDLLYDSGGTETCEQAESKFKNFALLHRGHRLLNWSNESSPLNPTILGTLENELNGYLQRYFEKLKPNEQVRLFEIVLFHVHNHHDDSSLKTDALFCTLVYHLKKQSKSYIIVARIGREENNSDKITQIFILKLNNEEAKAASLRYFVLVNCEPLPSASNTKIIEDKILLTRRLKNIIPKSGNDVFSPCYYSFQKMAKDNESNSKMIFMIHKIMKKKIKNSSNNEKYLLTLVKFASKTDISVVANITISIKNNLTALHTIASNMLRMTGCVVDESWESHNKWHIIEERLSNETTITNMKQAVLEKLSVDFYSNNYSKIRCLFPIQVALDEEYKEFYLLFKIETEDLQIKYATAKFISELGSSNNELICTYEPRPTVDSAKLVLLRKLIKIGGYNFWNWILINKCSKYNLPDEKEILSTVLMKQYIFDRESVFIKIKQHSDSTTSIDIRKSDDKLRQSSTNIENNLAAGKKFTYEFDVEAKEISNLTWTDSYNGDPISSQVTILYFIKKYVPEMQNVDVNKQSGIAKETIAQLNRLPTLFYVHITFKNKESKPRDFDMKNTLYTDEKKAKDSFCVKPEPRQKQPIK